jgi:hypothetical protein
LPEALHYKELVTNRNREFVTASDYVMAAMDDRSLWFVTV